MLHFQQYRKSFGDHLVLSIPDLRLPQGLYWLKGENGAGKTTLIQSLAGLVPFQGAISVDGVSISTSRTAYRHIVNYAEAEPAYPAFLTGSDLIRFYAETKKASAPQIIQLTEVFGVGGYVGNKISTYSSGMAKKLSLVLGFMGNPRLILLDEPLITLDVRSVDVLKQVMEDYYSKGAAFIITSHQEIQLSSAPVSITVMDKTLSFL